MDFATTVIAGGLRSRAETLDVLANNLANANTFAYKADLEQFQIFVPEWIAPGSAEYDSWAKAPDLAKSHINFTQGSLEKTNSALDLAIEGEGFFTLEKPDGVEYLSRAGSFQLGMDGQIRNGDGFKLKLIGLDGKPVEPNFRLDPEQLVKIGRDGIILQDGVERARVSIVNSTSSQMLERQGKSYFAFDSQQVRERIGGYTLHQGMLERSNFDPLGGSVQLIHISRQFEMLQKALQLHGEMGRRVTEEIGKV